MNDYDYGSIDGECKHIIKSRAATLAAEKLILFFLMIKQMCQQREETGNDDGGGGHTNVRVEHLIANNNKF